jgi:hypothetical protein
MRETKNGTAFEKAVASIQALLDTSSDVTHNEKIVDRYGHSRQFDVVIRGKLGGYSLFGVIECKDTTSKVDIQVVDAFLTKVKDVNANFGIIASNSGFSKKALEKCKANSIGAISLIPNDSLAAGFSITMQMFVCIYDWNDFAIGLSGTGNFSVHPDSTINEFFIKDQSVFEWFQHFLDNELDYYDFLGEFRKLITFKEPQVITARNYVSIVHSIELIANRNRIIKHKWVSWTGDGLYEWNENKIVIPPKGSIITEPIRMDFEDWQVYDGELFHREDLDIQMSLTIAA